MHYGPKARGLGSLQQLMGGMLFGQNDPILSRNILRGGGIDNKADMDSAMETGSPAMNPAYENFLNKILSNYNGPGAKP